MIYVSWPNSIYCKGEPMKRGQKERQNLVRTLLPLSKPQRLRAGWGETGTWRRGGSRSWCLSQSGSEQETAIS